MTPLDPHKLLQLNQPVPRYTSYPPAPEWGPLAPDIYAEHLQRAPEFLSLYFHIPFCKTMCLYCACSVVLNRKTENEERYARYLCREIDLVVNHLTSRKRVAQLHFGGGTPTQLSEALLAQIMEKIQNRFSLHPESEIAIEIDPRTVIEDKGSKLKFLKEMGFNRVSFGVQDTDPHVQEAIRRRQSYETTERTYLMARELGFDGINIDLIYGLPFQTQATFRETVSKIIALRPDRIAMFSYAIVPWLKPHQNAIKEETLPSAEEKFRIYVQARQQFLEAGYIAIGMDHFALPDNDLAQAFLQRSLQRNFQGYSLRLAENLIGLGTTATGYVSGAYFQNQKELSSYYQFLDQGKLPILRGKVMSEDDHKRKWVIHRLMCNFELSKNEFELHFGIAFDHYFAAELEQIKKLTEEQLLEIDENSLKPTLYGKLFIRNIASIFDRYLAQKIGLKRFSKAI